MQISFLLCSTTTTTGIAALPPNGVGGFMFNSSSSSALPPNNGRIQKNVQLLAKANTRLKVNITPKDRTGVHADRQPPTAAQWSAQARCTSTYARASVRLANSPLIFGGSRATIPSDRRHSSINNMLGAHRGAGARGAGRGSAALGGQISSSVAGRYATAVPTLWTLVENERSLTSSAPGM